MTNDNGLDAIFQQLDENTSVLTPNRRLSATLQKLYQAYHLNQQHQCWHTPDILPISTWIQRFFDHDLNFTSTLLLLNTIQDQFLWEKIISQSKESATLLQVAETADMAKSAWNLLRQWNIDTHHPIFNSADDYAALHHWTNDFTEICQQKNWIDYASLPHFVAEKIKKNAYHLPSQLILIGFTELSPQLKMLLAYCEEVGTVIKHITLSKQHSECKRISLIDQEDEIITIARWAKSTLKKNVGAKIGCVIPNLDKKRDRVMQIFSEIFADEHSCSIDTQSAFFNISAGKSLIHYPIINTALQLLSLHKKNIDAETFSYLLTSPFLGKAETEQTQRVNFDRLLRKRNVSKINLIQLTKINDNKKILSLNNYCPLLTKRMICFRELLDDHQKSLTYREWAALFNQLLSTLGWPGERSLSSEEYQVVESWLNLLNEFATLDHITQPIKINDALKTLRQIAIKTIFQAKTPDAPIQVLGILEAAQLPFDFLWVAGMDDLSWPPQPRPNPFIPKSLQRELNMPHATAERELLYCQQLTQQFKQSANHVIFSHAEKNEELELQASALIREFPEIQINQLGLEPYQSLSERIFHTKLIEKMIDENAPPHQSNDIIRGGISVIKHQALCPFKSFAEWRLHAHELEARLPGLRANDRGTLVHKILELVWSKLQSHATLISIAEQTLNELIVSCVNEALDSSQHSHVDYTQYIFLEKQRLQKLISDWLKLEKERQSFHVITHEKIAQITLNQLTLSIRIDRIDELADGKKLIIDYKTGKNNEISSWFSERPEEPQLPLYTLIEPHHTIGITFAQIAPGQHCFKGVSQYSLDIKGIKLVQEIKKTTAISWDEQLVQWKNTLTKLSDDFFQGIAKVDPKEPGQTCMWCALKPLCRIDEEVTQR